MAGYDPKKAAEYNRLIQQGVNPDDAIAQAGITYEEQGNYEINSVGTPATNADYGKMSAISIGQGKVAGVDYDKAPPEPTPTYAQTTKVSYTTTSTETVSGGGETTITAGPRIPNETSQAYASAGIAKQAEIDQYIKDNPSNFARKRQGLPLLTPEENAARNAQLNSLQDQRSQLYNNQIDAETATPGSVSTTPNTTTTTTTTTSQLPATRAPVNFGEDEQLNQSTEAQLDKTTQIINGSSARDTGLNPTSDPSQFPAYDDEGNLMPGYAINNETGDTYFQGQGPLTQQTAGFDPNYDEFGNYDAAVAAQQVDTTSAANVNDPYYGLTPEQLQWLGNADPTDPYIRARGGIPQLPGSTLFATGGFGTIKTGVPAIDSALGIIGKVTSVFSNFANTIGGLFGGKPTASVVAATTGLSVAGLTQPAPTPAKTNTTVTPTSDPSQFPAYDDEGNLMPGFAINPETGGTYYAGVGPATKDQAVTAPTDYGTTYDEFGTVVPKGPPTSNTSVSPASDPSQFPAYDDEGNLMPGFAINPETGGTYYHGVTPGTQNAGVNPASDPSQFPAYDDEGNLQPGFAINPETGGTYYHGVTPGTTNTDVTGPTDYGTTYDEFGAVVPRSSATGTNATTLSADQADAFYNGTGTPTAAERAATDAQTAADAAVLYPGTNNTNLKEINAAQAAIDQNNAGITRAEAIIAQNNAELADENLPDDRRAELEANNALQLDYIQVATENTAINQEVIESNANAFAAGGGNPDSGQGPMEVAALADPELPQAQDATPADWYDAGNVDPAEDPFEQARLEAEAAAAAEGPPTDNLDIDPLTDEELAVQEAYQQDNREILADQATDVEPGDDPFEQARLEAAAAAAAEGPTEADLNIDPLTDEELAIQEAYQQDNRDILASEATDVEPGSDEEFAGLVQGEDRIDSEFPEDVNPDEGGLELPPGAEPDGEPTPEPYALNPDEDAGLPQTNEDELPQSLGDEESFQGAQQASVLAKAKQQATFQARYKQQNNSDWRFRLSLSPNAKYLYNAGDPGILQPLAATDGVIFPYTPSVTTTYSANYEQYDLIHSNYRGVFYKNSRVGDIQIRGTFTAQDTKEAAYLLAVIHFFRSATKMFYGQDGERGTPPPICLLNGLGQYQFSDHPVLITSFNYTLPNDVDYIRTTSANNFGPNMSNRNVPSKSNPNGSAVAGANRLLNAGLALFAQPKVPAPNNLVQTVNNTAGSTYVPTKMEIDITCIPIQTRSQVSKQFSLKGFANGDLLKGGFW